MKTKITLIITLCSLSTWAFAQITNGGAVHSSSPVIIKPPSNNSAQTAPGLNRPGNANPNNPTTPRLQTIHLIPITPAIPGIETIRKTDLALTVE